MVNNDFISPENLSNLLEQFWADDTNWQPDSWQQEVLSHDGNVTIRSGRQVGKSEVISRKAASLALRFPNSTILMIAAAQRQSSLLFEKTLNQLNQIHGKMLEQAGGFQDNPKWSIRQRIEFRRGFEAEKGLYDGLPTKTELRLKNGSRIYSLPAGKTGIYIKGYTVDFLIVDEAAFVPEPVWLSIVPMIAVSRQKKGLGWIILLSTPFGKGGFFYKSHFDKDFKQFHISSEDCSRIPKEFLLKEQKRLSRVEYAQEYLGEFIDEYNQLWKTELLKSRMTFISYDFQKEFSKEMKYYLGVDVARLGEDDTAFVVAELDRNNYIRIIMTEVYEKKTITQIAGLALRLDQQFHFSKLFIDDAGLGAGLYDILHDKLRSRVVGLQNAKKSLDDEKRRKLFKEDMYSNATVLMEQEKIAIIADLGLLASLRSMTYEYTLDGNLRIYGPNSHLAEAFVRACWCIQDKGLKLFLK